jgi:hypothetical protein
VCCISSFGLASDLSGLASSFGPASAPSGFSSSFGPDSSFGAASGETVYKSIAMRTWPLIGAPPVIGLEFVNISENIKLFFKNIPKISFLDLYFRF